MAEVREWEVRSERPGTFDLRADRRPVRYDYDSLEEALRDAKRRGATEVTVVESDGYRVKTRV